MRFQYASSHFIYFSSIVLLLFIRYLILYFCHWVNVNQLYFVYVYKLRPDHITIAKLSAFQIGLATKSIWCLHSMELYWKLFVIEIIDVWILHEKPKYNCDKSYWKSFVGRKHDYSNRQCVVQLICSMLKQNKWEREETKNAALLTN